MTLADNLNFLSVHLRSINFWTVPGSSLDESNFRPLLQHHDLR